MSKHIDLETGLGRVRGNKKLYSRMLGMFLESPEIDAFEQALADNDNVKAAELAHAIKGMTGNLALTTVFEASEQCMQQLHSGEVDPAFIASYKEGLQATRVEAKELQIMLGQEIE